MHISRREQKERGPEVGGDWHHFVGGHPGESFPKKMLRL